MLDGTPSLDPATFERLMAEIGNYSYHSGLPCRD